MATDTSATNADSPTRSRFRYATWRNLVLTYVLGVVILTIASIGYHVHTHENDLASDVPTYAISGVVFALVAAVALLVSHRSRNAALPGRIGIVLAALAIAAYPVSYYMPAAVIWGGTSFLLGRDSAPGRSATAARVLGIIAVALSVLHLILRWAGVTYQVGG